MGKVGSHLEDRGAAGKVKLGLCFTRFSPLHVPFHVQNFHLWKFVAAGWGRKDNMVEEQELQTAKTEI